MGIFSKDAQEEKSIVATAVCAVVFFSFVAGYYWGKTATTQELQDEFNESVLADKIAYATALDLEDDI
jgi:hypothetical protein